LYVCVDIFYFLILNKIILKQLIKI